MPLEDSPWSRGKCAYKALQYMAAGVPVIASPVGMSTELLEHDRNGLLAGDRDAWEEALVALVEDQERRARIGAQGRLDVQREYTYEAVAGPWAEHTVSSKCS